MSPGNATAPVLAGTEAAKESGRETARNVAHRSPIDNVLELLAGRGTVRNAGNGYMATCPAHADGSPSLSVTQGEDGRVLLHCFAGCENDAVVSALGITLADLFPPRAANGNGHPTEFYYSIKDIDGNEIAWHCRRNNGDGTKDMWWCRPGGGKGLGGRKVRDLPLYGSEHLKAAPADVAVIVTEGEKDANALQRRGLLAVGTVTGAGGKVAKSPSKKVLAVLKDREVVLWPDADPIGQQHMVLVARQLQGIAKSVRMVQWPDAAKKSGAADFAGTDDELRELLDVAADASRIATESVGANAAADGRLSLCVSDSETGETPLHVLVPRVVELLAQRDQTIYASATALALVHVVADDAESHGVHRSTAPRIRPLGRAVLRERLDGAVQFIKRRKTKEGPVENETLAPLSVVDAVHARGSWPGMRSLLGVTSAPVLRPDGTVLDVAGYDQATRLIYSPTREYPSVPDRPTDAQVDAAVQVLAEPFRDFPAATPADHAAILALMLSIAARPAISGPVPAFLFLAPTPGTGKTLLCDAATAAMTGHGPDVLMWTGGRASDADAEMRKRIGALALEAPAVALLDNVPDGGELRSAVLSGAITADHLTERILGQSETMREPMRIIWAVSGNNITVAHDLARRSLSVLLDAATESPHLRTGFAIRDLRGYVRERHPQLLVAALTVLRGFIAAGRPQHEQPPLGSFESWDSLVRSAVVWAQGPDPVTTQNRLLGDSPEMNALAALLDLWHAEFDANPVRAADLLRLPHFAAVLADCCATTRGEVPSPVALGKYLQKVAGKVVGNRRLQVVSRRSGIVLWGLRNASTTV